MSEFQFFRQWRGPGDAVYYRVDPDAKPDRQVRVSDDGLWAPTVFEGVDDFRNSNLGGGFEVPAAQVPCHLCMLVAGSVTRVLVREWPDAVAVTPRPTPAVGGHVVVIPRAHVRNAREDWAVAGLVRVRAAELQSELELGSSNYIDSDGRAATQSETEHMHGHLVPRCEGDGLHLPWTGQIAKGGA